MKLFISQPMNGQTDEEILAEREAVKAYYSDYEIIDSFFEEKPEGGNVPLKYLAKSLELMADANLVYFCEGWNHARGCMIEHACAALYDIPYVD